MGRVSLALSRNAHVQPGTAALSTLCSSPYLLALAPVYSAFLWWWWCRRDAALPVLRRRLAFQAVLQGGAALCLILAAAGLQVPAHAPRQVLVAAADLSDSIFDLASQTPRLAETLNALNAETTQAAVVVFGRTVGLEQRMTPLSHSAPSAAAASLSGPFPKSHKRRPLVDLTRPATVVDRSATDLGAALTFARGLFPPESATAARGILVLSDFRDTCGSAKTAAASLAGSGIDLLALPAALGPSADVHIAALSVPGSAQVGRDLPVEVIVASQTPCTVQVAVWRTSGSSDETPVDFKTVALVPEPGMPRAEIRKLVRILDRPTTPGIAVYTARISGAEGGLPGDITLNNRLSAATRVAGVSRWAVLARPDSTLARLANDKAQPLGAAADLFAPDALPQRAAVYEPYAGILVNGLSAAELPEGAALLSLASAVENGKALVAVGGQQAFGAGGHREGTWERLLPVEMTPEDDRTRAVLFVVDVSKSMEQRMGRDGSGVRKVDFAAEQLALAVQKLKPLDRLGLISFSGSAQLAAPLSAEPNRSAFLNAVKDLAIRSNTDLLPALKKAQETLQSDDAEEQLVVILSDGVQTVTRPNEELIQAAKALCPPPRVPPLAKGGPGGVPRRTSIFTFGIGVDAKDTDPTGELLLKSLAEAGGGTFSPEFLKLAERLEQAFTGTKKDFYVRRDPFACRPAYEHPLLPSLAKSGTQGAWPVLPFRNRVKAKPAAETIFWSASPALPPLDKTGTEAQPQRPDPLLTLSGPQWAGASRRAVLALSLDGAPGTAFFADESCRRLLPALLEWSEARLGATPPGWVVEADSHDDDAIDVEVRARDPVTGLPLNGRKLFASLAALQFSAAAQPSPAGGAPVPLPAMQLHQSAPGTYRALLPQPAQGVYRLSIQEEAPGNPKPETRNPTPLLPVCEHFLTVPYPAELRRFGTDRAFMQELVALSADSARGPSGSRIIERPQDLARWAVDKAASRETYPLRPWLIALGMALLLVEYALRGRR